MRRKVGLIDHEDIGFGDRRAAFSRNFFARGNVDYINGNVGQFGAECRRQIIAAALNQNDLNVRMPAFHFFNRRQID